MKNIRVLAVIAILIGAATLATTEYTIVIYALAQATDNATMGGNMTGGNMTGNMTMGGGNMTDGNMTEATGQISGGGGRCGGTCYADSD
jgi:Spy/CpxP family protein refolding chaperone